jgi:hypothetical protein
MGMMGLLAMCRTLSLSALVAGRNSSSSLAVGTSQAKTGSMPLAPTGNCCPMGMMGFQAMCRTPSCRFDDWLGFGALFAGRNLAAEDRIYAVVA